MLKPATPSSEFVRLRELRALDVLDTPSEERFDRYTRIARHALRVPIALISLVDANRQWFKSRQGLDATETSRDVSFCGHAILHDDIMVVTDARCDERFADNPLVTGEPWIRFYAGCPIRSVHGAALGTLCVIDRVPRHLELEDLLVLRDLAGMVSGELNTLQLATVDDLTQLKNRRGFNIVAMQVLAQARRRELGATLLYFDLDQFKPINDRFGHAEGDRALQDFSKAMLEVFRESDVVARIGGDEFCVLLSDTGGHGCAGALARLDQRLASAAQGRKYAIAYSVGTVPVDTRRHACVEALLADGDAAMYERKRARHGSDGGAAAVKARKFSETDLRPAPWTLPRSVPPTP